MKQYKVLVSRRYHQDLKSILGYMIHDLKAPIAASNFLNVLEETVQSLQEMPYRFELVKDETLKQQGYRKYSVKNYLLFYKILENEKVIRIYRLIYGKRNWERML